MSGERRVLTASFAAQELDFDEMREPTSTTLEREEREAFERRGGPPIEGHIETEGEQAAAKRAQREAKQVRRQQQQEEQEAEKGKE